MLTCEITDIANSDCQGITQVFNSLYYSKDACRSNELFDIKKRSAKKKPKSIALSPRNTKVYNECNDVGIINSFDTNCKPISPPIVSSTTSSIMAANSNKRQKKCRREYGYHKKHTKVGNPVRETCCPISSADPISPKVTPIFVWANVDDTKIVHVLCEDYDKRNRIRLTRTAKGWRSVPLIESLEKCRQMAASQSPLDSISPRLVHNSPTLSDNCLQTDNLSNYPIANEFSCKGESIGVVADSTNQDHTFNEAVLLPSNSRDDAFSSDEDGQQENLRCMINKMQSDSLYSDDECEASVSTTQEDKIILEDMPYEDFYSSKNYTESKNFVSHEKAGETVTSPSHKVVPQRNLHQLSPNFPDNFVIMCQSSNSEKSNNIDRTVPSPNLSPSSENMMHQNPNTDEVTNSEIILELLNRDDISRIADTSTSYSQAAIDNNLNYSFDKHNHVENMDQSSDNMKEHITFSHQVTSSEIISQDLHDNFSNNNSNTLVESENDAVLSSKPLSASNYVSNGTLDNRKDCCFNTSNELSLSTKISISPENLPNINKEESLSNNFIDSNCNIINYSSINDTTSSIIEKAVITSQHEPLSDDEIGKFSTDNYIDNNSNIVLESGATDEILINIEDTPTSQCISSPKINSIDHLKNSMTNNENVCSSEGNDNHTDQNITSNNVIGLNSDCSNTNIDIVHQPETDVERPLSVSLPTSPSPENEISLQERYTNLSKTENSILSTLLQTDIIIGKKSEVNITKKSISEADKDLTETLDPEVSFPASTLESVYGNLSTENEIHQPEMLKEHSPTMEFLYRSYFESPFIIQDDDTRELLQSLHANNQCMDLSTQRKSKVDENGGISISADMLTEEKSNPSNFGLHKGDKSIKMTCQNNEEFNYHEIENNCNSSNVKTEVICNEMSLFEKNKLDPTVQKVPLCQTLKSSNKCLNTRRLLIRKQLKLSEDDSIPDETLFKEPSSTSYSTLDEVPSTDIKPNHQNNVPRKDVLFPFDKSQVKPTKLLRYQPSELVISKVPMQEKEKSVISAKMKPNPVILLTKEKSTALDPLEQLKDVLSNPMYSVPDPLLVPKARLPALVSCPGREIPRLLARHTQNFSYVSILSDPDVLVVSLSHLRSLVTKPLNENDIQEYQKHTEEIRSRLRLELLNYQSGLEHASLFGNGWNDLHIGPPTPSVPPSKPVSSSKGSTDDLFRRLNAAYNPLNLCYPADMGRDINGNCSAPVLFEKGPLPWSNEVFNGPKSNPPTYDPCGVSWNDQLCAHLGCFQTASGACSLGRNDLLYCPFDSQLRNSFPSYLHSTLSCANSIPVLRDFGAKNCLPEFCYPWMDITRSVDDKGRHQQLENPFESLKYSTKASQPVPKLEMELKMESTSFDEFERTSTKMQSRGGNAANNLSDKRNESVEPKIKVRQHLVDPNRRPLLLNPQSQSPYESSATPFLRPWSNEGFPHPFWFR